GAEDQHEAEGQQCVDQAPDHPECEDLTGQVNGGEGHGPGHGCDAHDPSPPRNTARSRSSRSARSAAGPSKRTWPFSMNTARSATASATFTDCSTIRMVVPASRSSSTMPSSCWTIAGA